MKQTQNLNRISSYAEYQKKMADYETHINMMIGKEGQPIPLNVMIVSGDKGVGKTYAAERLLEKQTVRPYQIVKSAMSAVELYKFMWHNNDAIIVLDDVNGIIQDNKDGASLLKACTETRHIRKLNWQKQNPNCIQVHSMDLVDNKAIADKMNAIVDNSGSTRLRAAHLADKTFPDTFFFTGAIIILTNKPLAVIDRATEGAVSNRGWHQEMLFTLDGAVDLLKNFATKLTSFNDFPLQEKNVKTALKFMTSKDAIRYYKNNGKIPTIRNLGKIALECETGNVLDEDTLANNTETPAY